MDLAFALTVIVAFLVRPAIALCLLVELSSVVLLLSPWMRKEWEPLIPLGIFLGFVGSIIFAIIGYKLGVIEHGKTGREEPDIVDRILAYGSPNENTDFKTPAT